MKLRTQQYNQCVIAGQTTAPYTSTLVSGLTDDFYPGSISA